MLTKDILAGSRDSLVLFSDARTSSIPAKAGINVFKIADRAVLSDTIASFIQTSRASARLILNAAFAYSFSSRLLLFTRLHPDKLYMHNQPLGDILRNIGFQCGHKADVVVYPQRRVIELRYAKA